MSPELVDYTRVTTSPCVPTLWLVYFVRSDLMCNTGRSLSSEHLSCHVIIGASVPEFHTVVKD